MILGTCWTTFVLMSRLKSRCLKLKMTMSFFWNTPYMKTKVVPFVRHSDIFLGHRWFFFDKTFSSTLSREFRVHRAGSQLKISKKEKTLREHYFVPEQYLEACRARAGLNQVPSRLRDSARISDLISPGWILRVLT